ncbi:tyrosinase-like protein 2 [Ylistrum balloti]|uniref:tyrosinase-like protein 2 n=1 Tax=Ylistrum balloti TaxID=509963 RepID=UPI002905BB29|nr:tyrosinase-like protein 2 [Ylistrum balloti]
MAVVGDEATDAYSSETPGLVLLITSSILALVTGSILIRGLHQHTSGRNRKCQQYRGSHGNFEITEKDDSLYCFHQHLYRLALDSSPTHALHAYVQELLWKALSRCEGYGSENGKRERTKTTMKEKCFRKKNGRKKQKGKCKRKRESGIKTSTNIRRCSWERKEVRMMSRTEWKRFVNRLNILKEAIPVQGHGTFVPYDIISDLHRENITIHASHGGPGFLGWHRVYLLLLEAALGVPIPYWDSRMDYDMTNPTDSVLWTSEFFGPGFGIEDSGPFANWITPENESLVRNIGNNGSLVSSDMVETLLRYTQHSLAVEPSINTIEDIHVGPHRWVDGQMSSLETAPQDPIFFLHHSFVDYIWSKLRDKMRKIGKTDPKFDYPCKGPVSHDPYATMIPFGNLPNIYGYSDHLESLTHYRPPPTCPDCGGSPYLLCDKVIQRCKSKPDKLTTHSFDSETTKNIRYRIRAIGIIHLGRKFEYHIIDHRTRGDTLNFLPLINRGISL